MDTSHSVRYVKLITRNCMEQLMLAKNLPCVARIFNQHDEQKLYFNLAEGSGRCYKAKMLLYMYQDVSIKLYLLLLLPVL